MKTQKIEVNTPLLGWLRAHTEPERAALAEKADTSVQYLYQVATGHRNASRGKAEKIAKASRGKLTMLQVLFPAGVK